MSIGKNSIARAVNSTAPAKKEVKPASKNKEIVILSVAVADIKSVKGFYTKEKAQEELVLSIKEKGIIEPLFVASTADGKFYLLDGALRLDAAKTLGLKTVSAVVIAVADEPEARAIYKELKNTAKKPQVIVKTEVKEIIKEVKQEPKPQKEKTVTKERAVREVPVYLL